MHNAISWASVPQTDLAVPGFKKGLIAMTRIFSKLVAAGVLAASLSASANAASGTACDAILSAGGRATRVEGSADFEKYNGHVPDNLAHLRAISAWQSRVADLCPGYSANWRRATNTNVDCDAGMGHENCLASAQPRRKFFSWILPR